MEDLVVEIDGSDHHRILGGQAFESKGRAFCE